MGWTRCVGPPKAGQGGRAGVPRDEALAQSLSEHPWAGQSLAAPSRTTLLTSVMSAGISALPARQREGVSLSLSEGWHGREGGRPSPVPLLSLAPKAANANPSPFISQGPDPASAPCAPIASCDTCWKKSPSVLLCSPSSDRRAPLTHTGTLLQC